MHRWLSARGDELSSDIVARNRSPPAVVVRGEEDKDITMRIIRCTCPVKPCWVRRGGRSSIGEDRVTSCGQEGERTSRLSIDPPWFTPLIIWVSLSLTPWISQPPPFNHDNNLPRPLTTRKPASSLPRSGQSSRLVFTRAPLTSYDADLASVPSPRILPWIMITHPATPH